MIELKLGRLQRLPDNFKSYLLAVSSKPSPTIFVVYFPWVLHTNILYKGYMYVSVCL